jgi:hypothetical protein
MRVTTITQVEWDRLKDAFPHVKVGNQRVNHNSTIDDNELHAFLGGSNFCNLIVSHYNIKSITFCRIWGRSKEEARVMLKTKSEMEDCPSFNKDN